MIIKILISSNKIEFNVLRCKTTHVAVCRHHGHDHGHQLYFAHVHTVFIEAFVLGGTSRLVVIVVGNKELC